MGGPRSTALAFCLHRAEPGALIGSFIPGPGTVIGAFLFGVIGAVGAKLAATEIRHIPFKTAHETYNATVENAQSSVRTEIMQSERRVRAIQSEYQQNFLSQRDRIERDALATIAKSRGSFEQELIEFCESFPKFLLGLANQLKREEQLILACVPKPGVFDILLPTDASLYRRAVKAWFRRAHQEVQTEINKFIAIRPRSRVALYREIQDFLGAYSFSLQDLTQEVAKIQSRFAESQDQAREAHSNAIERVESVRTGLIKDFNIEVEKIQERITHLIDSWNSTIGEKRTALKTEAAAIGIDP